MYRIWLVNFGWYSQHEFATEAEARRAYAEEAQDYGMVPA